MIPLICIIALLCLHLTSAIQCDKIQPSAILKDLYLSQNLFDKSDLYTSSFDICQLEGVNCQELSLNLSGAGLTGHLSDTFFCLDIFKTINLSHNPQLTANISNIRHLQNILNLDLSHTSVFGEFPDQLPNSLVSLNLANTCSSGTLNEQLLNGTLNISLNVSNTAIYGLIPSTSTLSIDTTCSNTLYLNQSNGMRYAAATSSICSSRYKSRCDLVGNEVSTYHLKHIYRLAKSLGLELCRYSPFEVRIITNDEVNKMNCYNDGGRLMYSTEREYLSNFTYPSVYYDDQCSADLICLDKSKYCIKNEEDIRICIRDGNEIAIVKKLPNESQCSVAYFVTKILELPFCFNSEELVLVPQNCQEPAFLITDPSVICDPQHIPVTNNCSECLQCKASGGSYCQYVNSSSCVMTFEDMISCAAQGGSIIKDCQLISDDLCSEKLQSSTGFCIPGVDCCECASCWAAQLTGNKYYVTLPGCEDRNITISNCLTVCPYYNPLAEDEYWQEFCPHVADGVNYERQSIASTPNFVCAYTRENYYIYETTNTTVLEDAIRDCLLTDGVLFFDCLLPVIARDPICLACQEAGLVYCESGHTCLTRADAELYCDGTVYCDGRCPSDEFYQSQTMDAQCDPNISDDDYLQMLSDLYMNVIDEDGKKFAPFTIREEGSPYINQIIIQGLSIQLIDSNNSALAGLYLMCAARNAFYVFLLNSDLGLELPAFVPPTLIALFTDSCNLKGEHPWIFEPNNNLEVFNLGNSNITGLIPWQLSRCSNLYYYSLLASKMYGTLPAFSTQFSGVYNFDIRCTNLVGSTNGGVTFLDMIAAYGSAFYYGNSECGISQLPGPVPTTVADMSNCPV